MLFYRKLIEFVASEVVSEICLINMIIDYLTLLNDNFRFDLPSLETI